MKIKSLLSVMLFLLVGLLMIPVTGHAVGPVVYGGGGDALVFPMYYTGSGSNNKIVLINTSGNYVQAHVRFRTSILSREVRDFDVVMSPFDAVSMSVEPVTEAGLLVSAKIVSSDASFRYNPLTEDYDGTLSTEFSRSTLDAERNILTPAELEHEIMFGYVEVFGEAVLNGLSESVAEQLVAAGQSINAWSWYIWNEVSPATRPTAITTVTVPALSDVGNILKGTVYTYLNGSEIAMPAIAVQNFRTNVAGFHRDGDNYARDAGVILHDSNFVASTAEARDYLYNANDATLPPYQQAMSWATTYGPTWLDGDDSDGALNDSEDVFYGVINSLSEVETAVSANIGADLHYQSDTHIMVLYPTKHLHFPNNNGATIWTAFTSSSNLISQAINEAKNQCVVVNVTYYDMEENSPTAPINASNMSPVIPSAAPAPTAFCHELSFASMADLGIGYVEGWLDVTFANSGWRWPTNANAYIGYVFGLDGTGSLTYAYPMLK